MKNVKDKITTKASLFNNSYSVPQTAINKTENILSHVTISDTIDLTPEMVNDKAFEKGIEILNQRYLSMILENKQLRDSHIDKFNEIFKKTTNYHPQGSYLVQKP